jgi:hypothetical protein
MDLMRGLENVAAVSSASLQNVIPEQEKFIGNAESAQRRSYQGFRRFLSFGFMSTSGAVNGYIGIDARHLLSLALIQCHCGAD